MRRLLRTLRRPRVWLPLIRGTVRLYRQRAAWFFMWWLDKQFWEIWNRPGNMKIVAPGLSYEELNRIREKQFDLWDLGWLEKVPKEEYGEIEELIRSVMLPQGPFLPEGATNSTQLLEAQFRAKTALAERLEGYVKA